MNKLVLIGNGFDLAHGLPTSYKDFLNDFWRNIEKNFKDHKDLIFIDEMNSDFFGYKKTNNYKDFIYNLDELCKEYKHRKFKNNEYRLFSKPTKFLFKFENEFFRIINTKDSIENWVDIENEYFLLLKKIAKTPKLDVTKSEDEHNREKKNKIKVLNIEFEQVKNLFRNYLKKNVIDKYFFDKIINEDAINPFCNYFKLPDFSDFSSHSNDFPYKQDFDELWLNINKSKKEGKNYSRELLFLNFNYTSSLDYYKGSKNEEIREIKIHGNLDNMIFGYGDETDEEYQSIENINDNEYLKNFKSFQYSSNPNYNDVFSLLDSGKFYIYVMGHSCGLSDRVLLNNIFEHKNCRGIKVFYHQKEDGSDNYLDIIQNISRHFNDKQSMRRKIVNKHFSIPLPQNVRFKKK
jgi:hypothetical protein|tara:strand:+ start:49 stop:1263 length:1215 start_codon:yes stop_codon:yes gene_type:complete